MLSQDAPHLRAEHADRPNRIEHKGRLDTRTASILKLKSTELAVTAAQRFLHIHGSAGYLKDSSASRIYRDVIGGTIAAGPSEIMRDMIYEPG